MTDGRVLLVTIPHTGTRFFKALLARHYPYVGLSGVLDGRPGFGAVHVTDSAVDALAPGDYVLATTWRQPDRVERSWRRRGRCMDEYRACRRRWNRMVAHHGPMMLSLGCDREQRLAEFGERLGVRFETDWEPVTDA